MIGDVSENENFLQVPILSAAGRLLERAAVRLGCRSSGTESFDIGFCDTSSSVA